MSSFPENPYKLGAPSREGQRFAANRRKEIAAYKAQQAKLPQIPPDKGQPADARPVFSFSKPYYLIEVRSGSSWSESKRLQANAIDSHTSNHITEIASKTPGKYVRVRAFHYGQGHNGTLIAAFYDGRDITDVVIDNPFK
jgi:hypothetical protein